MSTMRKYHCPGKCGTEVEFTVDGRDWDIRHDPVPCQHWNNSGAVEFKDDLMVSLDLTDLADFVGQIRDGIQS